MRVSTDRHEPRHNSALPVPEPCSSPGEGRKAKLSWRLLFSFTNKRHLGVLFPALASTVVVAATRILLSVILGKIFNYISQYSQGLRTGNSTLAEVSTWCIVLAGLGGGSWVANSSFLGFWIAFGEFQASEARKQVFASILLKRSQWFSSLSDGIEGLHTRIHTLVQTRLRI
jgi:ATP-binding cassette subfamily B (MDR/TAP) protein 1